MLGLVGILFLLAWFAFWYGVYLGLTGRNNGCCTWLGIAIGLGSSFCIAIGAAIGRYYDWF